MKKMLAGLFAAALLLSCFGCGGQKTEETAPVTEQSEVAANAMPDFTVQTTAGEFSLSEAVQSHPLTVIKLWATWCGYCGMDFENLKQVWPDYKDRVAVVALSIEPTDTPEKIEAYAKERGYEIPMGSAVGTGLEQYASQGVPVSLILNAKGELADVQIGAKASPLEFVSLFDSYLNAGDGLSFEAVCVDENGAGVPGCTLTFCTDALCIPVQTDANGRAVFEGEEAAYTVKLAGLPEGYAAKGETEQPAGAGQTVTFVLTGTTQ